MFSPMIQNLISTGGQKSAEQRAVQIQNHVHNLTAAQTLAPPNIKTKSFQEVLQTSNPANLGALLPATGTMTVQGQVSNVSNSYNYTKPSKPQLLSMVSQIAKKHGVDEKLVHAVVKQESGFNPKATSHCGAMGLMQLMPATAKGLGVTDPYNPVQNVEGGVRYLKNLLNKYNGNIILSLAAYNAGSGAVDKYDGVPPYKETQNYVKSILTDYLS